MEINEKTGVLSLPTILLYNAMKYNIEDLLKTNAVLFEDVKLITASLKGGTVKGNKEDSQIESAIKSLLKNNSFVTSKEFKEIFNYDKEFDQYSNKLISAPDGGSLFNSKENKLIFDEAIEDVVNKYEGIKHSDDDIQYQYVKDFYKNLMLNNYSIFENLSEKNPEYSSFISPIFRNLVFQVTKERLRSPKEVIQEVGEINLIDFSQFSWDEILELRNSEFAKDFRIKMSELIAKYSRNMDIRTLNSELDRYFKEANFKFISENKPDLKKRTIKGVLGKLPFMEFMNPVSIYNTIESIDDANFQLKEFGWLYFIQETYEKQR